MRQPRPFFRKQTQSWYVQIRGRQIPLGRDKAAAWKKYHELMAEHHLGPVADESVAGVLNRYLVWARANRARSTFKKKVAHLRSFAQHIGRQLKVSDLKPYHVQRWIDENYAGLSGTYVGIAISEVLTALNWAVRLGYVPRNPVAGMPKPRPGMREDVLPAARWPELLAAISDREFRDYITVSLLTGARAQEMPKIEARHFDREGRRIVFPRAESKGGRRARVIPLPDEAFKIVDRLARRWPEGAIFRNTRGMAWSKASVNCRFRRLKKVMGMRGLCATVLRHSYAHTMLTGGVDSNTVSKLMGHVDSRMVSGRYGHIEQDAGFMLQEARRIDSLLSGGQVAEGDRDQLTE